MSGRENYRLFVQNAFFGVVKTTAWATNLLTVCCLPGPITTFLPADQPYLAEGGNNIS